MIIEVTAATALPQFNEAAIAQLEGMGFPMLCCQKALLAMGNRDAEAVMEWLFSHMDDPGLSLVLIFPSFFCFSSALFLDINEPIQAAQSVGGPEPSPEQIAMLSDMRFTAAQASNWLVRPSGQQYEIFLSSYSHLLVSSLAAFYGKDKTWLRLVLS